MPPFLISLPVTFIPPRPHAVCPARVTPLHMDVIADKRRLMHVEGMAAPTHAHTSTKSPTYSYVSSAVTL